MANSKVQYTATGTTQTYAVTFPFLSRTHVTVTVDGVSDSFTWNNDSEIVVATVLSGGEIVLIKRSTSVTARVVDFQDGSNLTELDLDQNSKQAFYMAQEALDELTLFGDALLATSGHLLIGDGTEFVNKAMSGDATITSGGVVAISSDVIVNADINSAAAIAYSKLNLSDAIVNADINSAAAIAYSKLNLSDVIVNADINSAAAIAYSKLNLSGAIVNTDINSAAAIAYSKLNLSGAIVNADVAAGIDAVKLADGTVTNTELQYINSLTSNAQTQIDGLVSGAVTDVLDSTFAIKDDGDGTKKIAFQASGITTGTTRTITMPDADVTLISASSTDTLTNKTITALKVGVSAGNTANVNSAQGDNPITTTFYEIATCANAGDACTLPTAAAGLVVIVANNGAESADVFPASGDDINKAGVNTAYALDSGSNTIFICEDALDWDTVSGGGLIDVADLAVGTDGELITWDASGNPAVVAVGTAGHVLTSGGVGVAPTMQAPASTYLSEVGAAGTWDVSTTGTIAFTGAGFTPTSAWIFVVKSGITSADASVSWGFIDPSGEMIGIHSFHNWIADTFAGSTSYVCSVIAGSVSTATIAFASFDSDGLTLTKAINNGTPTGTFLIIPVFMK
jgi:hypothetical protein